MRNFARYLFVPICVLLAVVVFVGASAVIPSAIVLSEVPAHLIGHQGASLTAMTVVEVNQVAVASSTIKLRVGFGNS